MRKKRLPHNNQQLNASSLLLAIFISFIIGTLSCLLILRVYYYQHNRNLTNAVEKRYSTLESAISLALSDASLAPFNFSDNLFANDNIVTTISSRNWGIYRATTIKIADNHTVVTKNFLSGVQPGGIFTACLYLADHNKPLRLVGNALLKGDVYLPKNGITPGYIDGETYTGELFDGIQKTSTDGPASFINKEMMSSILSLLDSTVKEKPAAGGDSVTQSFTDEVRYISYQKKLQLEGYYKGQLIIHSNEMIEVTSNCSLENVIISAPYIKIDEGFTGQLQLFATDSISIEKNCHLRYPSAVMLIKKENKISMPAVLRIQENCIIDGTIITYVADPKDEIRSLAWLGENFTLNGILLIDGFVSLNGTIRGTLVADNIIIRKNSMIYDNYIMNTTINRAALSSHFLAPAIFISPNPQNDILQWLN